MNRNLDYLTTQFVKEHQDMIERMADELMEYKILDDAEIECLCDIVKGDATGEDLIQYRHNRKSMGNFPTI